MQLLPLGTTSTAGSARRLQMDCQLQCRSNLGRQGVVDLLQQVGPVVEHQLERHNVADRADALVGARRARPVHLSVAKARVGASA